MIRVLEARLGDLMYDLFLRTLVEDVMEVKRLGACCLLFGIRIANSSNPKLVFASIILSHVAYRSKPYRGDLKMKTKRQFKSKRAFSAIIASLILMLLAVAAGVVVYGYVMGWIGGATTNPRQTGHLSFDTMYANVTGKWIALAVRNVGGTNVVLSDVYVQGVNCTGLCTISGLNLNTNPYNLTVQQVANLNITSYSGMTVGSYYNVQVVCKDGTLISQSVQAQ
jgi:hypothetical protein